jgi:hypothetical protein
LLQCRFSSLIPNSATFRAELEDRFAMAHKMVFLIIERAVAFFRES